MPFQSKKQQAYMYIHHPKIAKRWAKKTPNMKKLPKKKKQGTYEKTAVELAKSMKK